jgi:hypothetical protein
MWDMGITGIGTAAFGFILGLIIGWIILRRGWRPIQFDFPAIEWVEKLIAIWKQDWAQAMYIRDPRSQHLIHCSPFPFRSEGPF